MPSLVKEYGLLLRPVAHLSYMTHEARLREPQKQKNRLVA